MVHIPTCNTLQTVEEYNHMIIKHIVLLAFTGLLMGCLQWKKCPEIQNQYTQCSKLTVISLRNYKNPKVVVKSPDGTQIAFSADQVDNGIPLQQSKVTTTLNQLTAKENNNE